jgi:hypothetical protein
MFDMLSIVIFSHVAGKKHEVELCADIKSKKGETIS